MPGQPGSENRQRQIVHPTRWSEDEFALLENVANYSGCTKAEVLRRLVNRSPRQILISRTLVAEVNKMGSNINQIARRLNSHSVVSPYELRQAYRDLLAAIRLART